MKNEDNILYKDINTLKNNIKEKDIEVIVKKTTTSTNEDAKLYIKENNPLPLLILAYHQSMGKGTKGKSFISYDKTGVYFSIVFKKDKDFSLFTILSAVASFKSIKSLYPALDIKIKWVNDLYKGDKKFSGILCESINYNDDEYIIAGIGININEPKGGFSKEIKDTATSLLDNEKTDYLNLVAKICDEFFKLYDEGDTEKLIKEYKENSLVLNKTVIVNSNNLEFFAKVIDINEMGHLILKKENGEKINLSTGTIRLEK